MRTKTTAAAADHPEPLVAVQDVPVQDDGDQNGEELPLNVPNVDTSLFTPSYNILQVPYVDDTFVNTAFNVVYKASPKLINKSITDITQDIDVDCPEFLREALISYITYKALSAITPNSPETIGYLSKFNSLIQESELLGHINKDLYIDTKIEDDQWA